MRILIAGAGIAGLSAARMLAVDGHEVVVAEQAPHPRAEGAGLLLHRRAVSALTASGFQVADLGVPLEAMAITTPTGRTRGTVRDRTSFARPELLEGLWRGACEVADVRVGRRVTHPARAREYRGATPANWAGAPRVDCEVGGRLQGFDVVVGADGISSPTRGLVQAGVPVVSTGQVCWRGIVALASGTRGTEMWNGAVRVGVVPLSRARTYVYVVTTGRAPGDADLDHLVSSGTLPAREHVATSLLQGLPVARRSRVELAELREPVWGRGRIALVGDAAHAMTPNSGLGAALAIDDAVALTRALRDPDRAVGRYRRQRRAVVRVTQLASRRLGHLAHSSDPLPRALRGMAGFRQF